MAGPIGREFFGAAQILFLIFVMGSHILTFSIMMNVLTTHGACTIVFGFVGFIVCLICTLPRTLRNVSYIIFAYAGTQRSIYAAQMGNVFQY